MEEDFCSNFTCCGKYLADLHALLQHYESCHVRIEEDDDKDKVYAKRKKRHLSIGVEPSSNNQASAFDDTVIRSSPFPSVQPSKVSVKEEDLDVQLVCNLLASNFDGTQTFTENIIEDRDRPYRCGIPGCDRSYKNPNGLKYHITHGHTVQQNEKDKPYKCTFPRCTKRYKNPNGLKYHNEHHHKLK